MHTDKRFSCYLAPIAGFKRKSQIRVFGVTRATYERQTAVCDLNSESGELTRMSREMGERVDKIAGVGHGHACHAAEKKER